MRIVINLFVLVGGIMIGYLLHQYDLGKNFFVFLLGERAVWFWTMVQALIITVTLAAIYQQIKLQRSANMLQKLNDLRTVWNRADMLTFRMAVCTAHKSKDGRREVGADLEVLNFFEEMAVMLHKHILPIEFVWDSYSRHIEHVWPMLKSEVSELRKKTKDDTYYEHCEDMWKSVLRYSKKRKAPSDEKNMVEINKYVDDELERINWRLSSLKSPDAT
jgi:hypothetical protein